MLAGQGCQLKILNCAKLMTDPTVGVCSGESIDRSFLASLKTLDLKVNIGLCLNSFLAMKFLFPLTGGSFDFVFVISNANCYLSNASVPVLVDYIEVLALSLGCRVIHCIKNTINDT